MVSPPRGGSAAAAGRDINQPPFSSSTNAIAGACNLDIATSRVCGPKTGTIVGGSSTQTSQSHSRQAACDLMDLRKTHALEINLFGLFLGAGMFQVVANEIEVFQAVLLQHLSGLRASLCQINLFPLASSIQIGQKGL